MMMRIGMVALVILAWFIIVSMVRLGSSMVLLAMPMIVTMLLATMLVVMISGIGHNSNDDHCDQNENLKQKFWLTTTIRIESKEFE